MDKGQTNQTSLALELQKLNKKVLTPREVIHLFKSYFFNDESNTDGLVDLAGGFNN